MQRSGLAGLRMLSGLPPDVLHQLQQATVSRHLAPGEWLFRQGDRTDGLYVVSTGQLDVIRDGHPIRRLGCGDVVGELGLLTGEPRSASVRARRETRLLYLSAATFTDLAAARPALPLAIARALARELQVLSVPEEATGCARVISVVAADGAAPAAAVSAAIVASLRGQLRVTDPGQVTGSGLQRAEIDHDRVILTAVGDDPHWRQTCLQVADRVVLVASTAAPPVRAFRDREHGADLVLTGAPPTRADVVSWHDALGPASAHVLGGRAVQAAIAPLAARLAGQSVGLVLAGGGARACAHLGVLAELEAAGIAVSRIAGTGTGAVIAALHALGLDAASVEAAVRAEFVRRNPLNDFTVPRHGLARGMKALAAIRRRCGDTVIEELGVEFRCVSADLLRGRPVVHSRGPLADAVMASVRLPGLFAPYQLGGTLHVDGGLLENVPVGALAGPPEGPVIAVSIPAGNPAAIPAQARMPGITETLMRSMLMTGEAAAEKALAQADVVVSPRCEDAGLLDWHQIDAMREAGRQAARAALPGILRLVGAGQHTVPVASEMREPHGIAAASTVSL